MIIETSLNLKNKNKEELMLLLNESLGVIEKLQKENEELRAKWDKDTHILQNKLDYANADRIDLAQQNKELRKENEELNNRCRNLDKEAQAYLEELAGDNTLTRRTIKQLQEENEELKEERQIVGIPVRNKRDRRIGIVLHQWESGSVAVLESINPRVINTHDSWNTLEIVTDEVKQTQTKCETIPVSLVKDKIEHYQKLQHNYIEKYDEINEGLQAMISALKELLGKE